MLQLLIMLPSSVRRGINATVSLIKHHSVHLDARLTNASGTVHSSRCYASIAEKIWEDYRFFLFALKSAQLRRELSKMQHLREDQSSVNDENIF